MPPQPGNPNPIPGGNPPLPPGNGAGQGPRLPVPRSPQPRILPDGHNRGSRPQNKNHRKQEPDQQEDAEEDEADEQDDSDEEDENSRIDIGWKCAVIAVQGKKKDVYCINKKGDICKNKPGGPLLKNNDPIAKIIRSLLIGEAKEKEKKKK